jgi:hypothetical protein
MEFRSKQKWINCLAILLFTLFSSCTSDNTSHKIACGGAMNLGCPIGTFCRLSEDCGGIDRKGFCSRIPESCTLEEQTICGCDNREYLNECTANTLSSTKKNEGRCIKSPTIETAQEDD